MWHSYYTTRVKENQGENGNKYYNVSILILLPFFYPLNPAKIYFTKELKEEQQNSFPINLEAVQRLLFILHSAVIIIEPLLTVSVIASYDYSCI